MAPAKNVGQNKKNQKQLKKGKKVVQVKQEEEIDNEDIEDSSEEEEDNDSENEETEEKESMDTKNEDESDEDDDDESDEDDDNEDDDNDGDASPKKKQKEQANEKPSTHTDESREEKDARSLYLGRLPEGVSEEDLKELSSDIVEIFLPSTKKFAFIRFNDEETAVSNFNVLKSKTIKDQSLTVDLCGSKSTFKNSRNEDKNARKLFVGSLPEDITENDFKSLSNDIVEIFISQGQKKFAFLTFDSQEKAESNYEVLKDQKIRGQQIFVDKCSSKGEGGMKQISVSGLPLDVTIDQVASIFKKAFQITLNKFIDNSYRTATITFDREEDAKEAHNAAKDAEISEHKLTSVLCESSETRPERGGGSFGGRGGGSFGGRGQFRGRGQFGGERPFRGGRNNWGKRSHDGGNFRFGRGGQGFAKKMRN